MSKSYWKNQIKFLFTLLSALSVLWLGFIIWNNLPELKKSFSDVNLLSLILIFTFSLLSSYLSFEAFRSLFSVIHPSGYTRKQLAHFYFISQMMKHLPGRVWGIAYQANQGSVASTMQWISINTIHMLINIAFAILIGSSILLLKLESNISLMLLILGLCFYFSAWKPFVLKPLISYLKSKNKNKNKILEILETFYKISTTNESIKKNVFYFFLFSWITYIFSWAGYCFVLPNLTYYDGIILCGIYTISWFLGYISFISPSGIGVREFVFFYLSDDFPIELVASIAIFARIILLCNDLTMGMIYFRERK